MQASSVKEMVCRPTTKPCTPSSTAITSASNSTVKAVAIGRSATWSTSARCAWVSTPCKSAARKLDKQKLQPSLKTGVHGPAAAVSQLAAGARLRRSQWLRLYLLRPAAKRVRLACRLALWPKFFLRLLRVTLHLKLLYKITLGYCRRRLRLSPLYPFYWMGYGLFSTHCIVRFGLVLVRHGSRLKV